MARLARFWFDGASEELGDIPLEAVPTGGTTGSIKVYDGALWAAAPVKVWDGAAWTTAPLKVWDGTAWIVTPY